MRATEDQIKSAILHPEEEIRLAAVGYWADGFCPDPTVMPLVIQSVEQYGRETAFRIMRDAESLEQTPETIQWLMTELGGDYDREDTGPSSPRSSSPPTGSTSARPPEVARRSCSKPFWTV